MTHEAAKKRGTRIGRRDLGCVAAAGILAAGCAGTRSPSASRPAVAPPLFPPLRFGGPVAVWSWFDSATDDARSCELSGLAWDDGAKVLWAVQDESANLVSLVPDRSLETWTLGPTWKLALSMDLDLEGIVVLPDGFVVASEKGPHLLELDKTGHLRREVPLPARFASARDNKSLESLTVSPDGRFLFTTTEAALPRDGAPPTALAGTRLRILRIARDGFATTEHAYSTDPRPPGPGDPREIGDYGVADLAALSDEDLLVLERGWTMGFGNTVRIYRVSLADPTTSSSEDAPLSETSVTMKKTLLVDLATLSATGLPASKQPQPTRLLDNYEGLTVGPHLPDGRGTLVLVSDDNGRSDQFARVLVLAVG